MKLYYFFFFIIIILLPVVTNTLQLSYSNITSLENTISLEQITWTLLVTVLHLKSVW